MNVGSSVDSARHKPILPYSIRILRVHPSLAPSSKPQMTTTGDSMHPAPTIMHKALAPPLSSHQGHKTIMQKNRYRLQGLSSYQWLLFYKSTNPCYGRWETSVISSSFSRSLSPAGTSGSQVFKLQVAGYSHLIDACLIHSLCAATH